MSWRREHREASPGWTPARRASSSRKGAEGGIAGVCWCHINQAENARRRARIGWINDLGVAPAFRRQGLGRALLTTGIGWLRDQGMDAIALWMDRANRERALYEDTGFQVDKSVTDYRHFFVGPRSPSAARLSRESIRHVRTRPIALYYDDYAREMDARLVEMPPGRAGAGSHGVLPPRRQSGLRPGRLWTAGGGQAALAVDEVLKDEDGAITHRTATAPPDWQPGLRRPRRDSTGSAASR